MEKDKTYKIRFMKNGEDLVFTGTVIRDDEHTVIFKDKFDKTLEYNKVFFVSAEEVGE